MKYNLKTPIDQQKFKEKCNAHFKSGDFVELRKVNLGRSLSQNAYLHLIIGWFAVEYGDTIDYVKEDIFKKKVNKAIFDTEFHNRVTGEVRTGLRSTKALDSKEMTIAIDRFRDYASKECGIYLPQPGEKEFLKHVQIEMEKHLRYI